MTVIENGYVLCDGGTIEAVGRMAELGRSTARSRSSTAAASARCRGSSTATRIPRGAATAWSEFSLRAGGASYEELHAAGGGILSTVRATRALGEDGLRERVERHAGWMLRHGTTTWEGKSGYGLDRETELASLRAVAEAGGRPTWLGAHAVPPEFETPTRIWTSPSPRCCRRLPGSRKPPTCSSSAARSTQRRRAGTSRRVGGPGSRCACTATSSPRAARSRSRSSSARGRSTISRQRARTVQRALAASDVVGVLLPASALFLDRPMPPARALVDAGAAIALATDFNPGSAFTTSLPLVCSLACTQLHLSPEEALAAVTANAAHVLGCAHDRGRVAHGFAPT